MWVVKKIAFPFFSPPMATSKNPTIKTRRLLGSSILCYGIDQVHNNIYFLLGSERYASFNTWHDGGPWCDFGGSLKASIDRGSHYNAAREFHEETLACVPFDKRETLPKYGRETYTGIAKKLARGEYTMRALSRINATHVYCTYLKQIPFDAGLPHKFSVLLNTLRHVHGIIKQHHVYVVQPNQQKDIIQHPAFTLNDRGNISKVNKDFMEKNALTWVSLQTLEKLALTNEHDGKPYLRESFRQRLRMILQQFQSMVQPRWSDARNNPTLNTKGVIHFNYSNYGENKQQQQQQQLAGGEESQQRQQQHDDVADRVEHAAKKASGPQLPEHPAAA